MGLAEELWTQTSRIAEFLREARFFDHEPANELLPSGGYCLARPGQSYILYQPTAGTSLLDLGANKGTFDVTWLDPVSGVEHAGGVVFGPGPVSLGPPPGSAPDWVVLVHNAHLRHHGWGSPGSADVAPLIGTSETIALPKGMWTVSVEDGAPGGFVALMMSSTVAETPTPLGAGELLLVPEGWGPPFVRTATADAEGQATFAFDLPPGSGSADGKRLYFQAGLYDPLVEDQWALTELLELEVHKP